MDGTRGILAGPMMEDFILALHFTYENVNGNSKDCAACSDRKMAARRRSSTAKHALQLLASTKATASSISGLPEL